MSLLALRGPFTLRSLIGERAMRPKVERSKPAECTGCGLWRGPIYRRQVCGRGCATLSTWSPWAGRRVRVPSPDLLSITGENNDEHPHSDTCASSLAFVSLDPNLPKSLWFDRNAHDYYSPIPDQGLIKIASCCAVPP